MLYQA